MSSFAYINARVRAWKSKLLDNAFIERLLIAKDSDAVSAMLGQTDYQKDIEKGVIKYEGVSGIEEGLRQNLTNTLQKLLKISGNEKKAQHLIGIILSRWDIYNLKTVLRGFHAEANEDEIYEQLIPVGAFDEASLRVLVKQPNMKTVISQLIVLSPEYAAPLHKGYKNYEQTHNLSELELGLDKSYFQSVLSQIKKGSEDVRVIKNVIRREIDFVNFMTLFRLQKEALPEDLDVETFFINGGSLPIAKFSQYLKITEIKELVDVFRRTKYYEALRKGHQVYQKNRSLAGIERALEDYNISTNIGLFKIDPLSVGTVVAFVWAKINEIVNIRIILRGKEVQMPADDIKEALVLV